MLRADGSPDTWCGIYNTRCTTRNMNSAVCARLLAISAPFAAFLAFFFFFDAVLVQASVKRDTVATSRPGRSAARNRQPILEVDSDDEEEADDDQ